MTTAKCKEALVKWCLENPDWLFKEFGFNPDNPTSDSASDEQVLEFAQAQEVCCKTTSWSRFSKTRVEDGSFEVVGFRGFVASPYKTQPNGARKTFSRIFEIKAAICNNSESELLADIRGFVDEYEDDTFVAWCELD